ncbi:multicopper oxidase family protein [Limobrevibacterium gyesilva]|uniref:Multicopper oxidase family protein n=1 Tax=Limobrevibacterium gyesilva TaxID=2991712 RepID=A0AA41YSJ4_9PROT|nr:multicopper oxidase family protein [Limobrevibacterium gyesilva]MCW3477538.1 multicopper oxidase family protein [Limobrevibacterium gyesilva]
MPVRGRPWFGARARRGQVMPTTRFPALSRRDFLKTSGTLAAATALPPGKAPGPAFATRLTPAPARVPMVGDDFPATAVWAYGGSMPGPVLRVRQGAPFQAVVRNGLDEDTTVHWHGVRLPNAMDGVPGLTQPPVRPGGSFSYAFTPPDAGTFWYHPHADGLVQMGRGLAGALIVEEAEPPQVDRELVWVIQDWRLTRDAQIDPHFSSRMAEAMAGRIGNTVTLNGRVPDAIKVRAGERTRLRLINAATARIMALRFAGHRPVIVALDGQPCDPHEPAGGRLLLGPAMRADLILDATGEPGSRHAVTDDFYGDELAYSLVEFAYESGPLLREHALDASVRLPPNPLPTPELASAERHVLALQGGMMGGMDMMGMRGSAAWAINGMSMTGDGRTGMSPLLTLARGQTCVLSLRNETAWWHPMHLHGHSFRLLTRNGAAVPGTVWGDTVLVPPREAVEVAFVADNPGDWMLHCHVMDHQASGLMTVIRVA